MSTENKIFTDSVRPEDSVSLSDLKNDGNEVHYAYPQERDEETVASTITGRSVTKNVAKREAVQQEEVEETDEYIADASHPVEDDADRALDVFDKVIIPKKIAEAKKFNEIMEETNGNISKQEMNELLGYGYANVLLGDEPVPLNTKPMERIIKARNKNKEKTAAENKQSADEIDNILNSVKTGFEDDFDDEDDL